MGVVNAEQDIAEVLSDGKSCSIDPSCHVCGDVAVVANVTLANQRWLGQLLNLEEIALLPQTTERTEVQKERELRSLHGAIGRWVGWDALIARQFF